MARSSLHLHPSAPLSFFLLAVAYSIGWTTVSSELARFSALFGERILLQLNLAYFCPSVLLLLVQTALDGHMDARYGQHRSYLFRVVAGYGGCTACLAGFPYLRTRTALLAGVASLGLFSSVAFGSSYQLVTRFDSESTIALTLGFVCSAPAVLLIEAVLRHGPECRWHQVLLLYEVVAGVAASGLVAAVLVQRKYLRWLRQQQEAQEEQEGSYNPLLVLDSPHSSGGLEAGAAAAVHAAEGGFSGGSGMSSTSTGGGGGTAAPLSPATSAAQAARRAEASHAALLDGWSVSEAAAAAAEGTLLRAWPAATSLGLSVATSMFLFPLFTHFPATGAFGPLLPVVLFWTRCFADIAGRLLPKACGPPPSATTLLCLTALKAGSVPFALLYVHGPLPPALRNDWALTAYVALQWLLGGALNTWSYLVLPSLVDEEAEVRAASVMTLVFNGSCLAGLLCAIPFQASSVVLNNGGSWMRGWP